MTPIETLDDIARDLRALIELHPALHPVADQAGPLALRRRPSDFAGLVQVIVGQQVSVASAAAIFGRLQTQVAPLTPETLQAAGDETLLALGLSRSKLVTIRGLAEACLDHLDLTDLARATADDARTRLCALKGIGPWTADVYLLFCAGHPDIFPSGDLALQVAVAKALSLGDRMPAKDLDVLARNWAPFRSTAARLFWGWYKGFRNGRESLPL
ncbi:DNA-3-methyladenine glycosylase family protein [Roseibium aestuarii]|uniref:DNA-3-methyladenine glycosylase II n=1 Tax=Roseibium aestuarii TaxID=2600299 RepID=A0ABW4K3Y8_9HYPH|nr:DNA-3-methyladenine glycosylase [Roseibium aestuarii]